MCGRKASGWALIAFALGLAALFTEPQVQSAEPSCIQIGLAESLLQEGPDTALSVMAQPFVAMMRTQTGMNGQISKSGDHNDLAQQLVENKVQLGIFHGIEFAWAKQKYPQLKPLMIAVRQNRYLRSCLLVRTDSAVKSVADLKGKDVALPRCERDHCVLFMERLCQEQGQCAHEHLGKVVVHANAEDAMDDLVDNVVQGAVIDVVALDAYKSRKPGRFAKLKTLSKSESFPSAVVVYAPGALDAAALKNFRDGMGNADKTFIGKQLLTLWKLSAFEPVPDDYDQKVTDIVKAYPAPKGADGK